MKNYLIIQILPNSFMQLSEFDIKEELMFFLFPVNYQRNTKNSLKIICLKLIFFYFVKNHQ